MSLSIGIVGLPNVGKSTLFNALLKQNLALAANYPFATIEPNVGIAAIPDERLAPLAQVAGTTVIKPATVEFIDIAGLVRGASKGEGLGNQFLAHIRATAAIAHVLRLFDDHDVIREGSTDPIADLQVIRLELQLADLALVERQKPIKGAATAAEKARAQHLAQFKAYLEAGKSVSEYLDSLTTAADQTAAAALARELNLLTSKPEIFVLNVSEKQLKDRQQIVQEMAAQLAVNQSQLVVVAAKVEAELATLSEADQKLFLTELGLTESGLARLAQVAYQTLKLQSYLTAGTLEVRAWTIPQGTTARQGAGVIHTDFIKKFIKAKIVTVDDYLTLGGWKAAAEAGRVRWEGQDYQLRPDDVVEFVLNS